jgi:alkylhydroperoxidase family enzyme
MRCFRTHFAEHAIVELSLLAGATAMLNRFCTALELPTTPATRARLEAAM